MNEADEIRQMVRAYQYDRYVAALLLPRKHREALIVLAAFGAELQRIPNIASEPMMAAIRMQWWRDELSAAAANNGAGQQEVRRTGHQLCDALVETAGSYNLPFGLLQGMIDAAETELDPTPFSDTAETRQVLIKFEGAMFELAGRILGSHVPRDVWADAAEAYGYARLSTEHGWRKRNGLQTYVSKEIGAEDQNHLAAFVRSAEQAAAAVRTRYATLDTAAKGALLPLATVPTLLRTSPLTKHQPDDAELAISNSGRALALLWAHWRGRI